MALKGKVVCDEYRRISSDHCGSSGINYESQLAVSCHIGRLDLSKCWVLRLFESWRRYNWNCRVLWFDGKGWSTFTVDRQSRDCGPTFRDWIFEL